MNVSKSIKAGTFAYTSPYKTLWAQHFYQLHFQNIFERKVKSEEDLRRLLEDKFIPEIFILGNFIRERVEVLALCRGNNINTVHSEDGFFPHYSSIHADPIGFCWESSLPQMKFSNLSDTQRIKAAEKRLETRIAGPFLLPLNIKKPFVLWPLQLIGDKVNLYDLNLTEWGELIGHFRKCLPPEYQIAIKEHPRSKERDVIGISRLAMELPNVAIIPKQANLKILISESNGVVGANSTALMEARLIFYKPTFAYAKSWFTNHEHLIFPISNKSAKIPYIEVIEDNSLLRTEYLDEYADWFLAQLISRQLDHRHAINSRFLRQTLLRLSYNSYKENGEEIFQ